MSEDVLRWECQSRCPARTFGGWWIWGGSGKSKLLRDDKKKENKKGNKMAKFKLIQGGKSNKTKFSRMCVRASELRPGDRWRREGQLGWKVAVRAVPGDDAVLIVDENNVHHRVKDCDVVEMEVPVRDWGKAEALEFSKRIHPSNLGGGR